MSESTFDIQEYMTRGVERVVRDAIRATLKNPRESVYMARFAAASKAAGKKRRRAEDAGEHIPPFLIASITSQCNLHCAGCYSRCNHATVDAAPVRQLTSEEWLRLFDEADDMGVSFILLAGGEPLLRRISLKRRAKSRGLRRPAPSWMKSTGLFDRCITFCLRASRAIADHRRPARQRHL